MNELTLWIIGISVFCVYITIGRYIAQIYIKRFHENLWKYKGKKYNFYGNYFFNEYSREECRCVLSQSRVFYFLIFYPLFLLWELIYRVCASLFNFFFFPNKR